MAKERTPGLAVDAAGGPVVDPTKNVLDLVAAGNQRQDDLRQMESQQIRREMRLRAEHEREMREAEADRLDAIREVDAQAVQQARVEQDTRATALAGQVAASAEAMRSQVAATTAAAATALATALAPITASIEQLRQAMYEAQGGKNQVVETQAKGANTGLWIGLGIAVAGVLVSVVLVLVTIAAIATSGFTK